MLGTNIFYNLALRIQRSDPVFKFWIFFVNIYFQFICRTKVSAKFEIFWSRCWRCTTTKKHLWDQLAGGAYSIYLFTKLTCRWGCTFWFTSYTLNKIKCLNLFYVFLTPTSPPTSPIGSVPCVPSYTLSSPAFKGWPAEWDFTWSIN